MARLTAAKRKKIPASEFAGKKGSDEEFPMPDKEHARLAIGGATRAEEAGNISKAEEDRIKAKARKKLGDGKGKKSAARTIYPKMKHDDD